MRIVKVLFFCLVLGITAGAVFYFRVAGVPLEMRADRVEFTIPAGSGLKSAAELIAQAGVGMPGWQLALLGRIMGRATQIKAGSYELHRGVTAIEVIDILTRGDVRLGRLTLVEGKTFNEFRALLDAHAEVVHDSLGMNTTQVSERLGMRELGGQGLASLEGQFLPETYLFDKGSSDFDVMRRAHDAMAKQLALAWSSRDPGVKVASAGELLVLASMVEKETGREVDRPMIASVFANRLRIGMPLQSDPTVIYGMGAKFDGNLRRNDLQTDTPWNTYTRAGLPPTPICMPGISALAAASRPPASTYFYFVARGDGSSMFSATLDEHNRAVTQFQKNNPPLIRH